MGMRLQIELVWKSPPLCLLVAVIVIVLAQRLRNECASAQRMRISATIRDTQAWPGGRRQGRPLCTPTRVSSLLAEALSASHSSSAASESAL